MAIVSYLSVLNAAPVESWKNFTTHASESSRQTKITFTVPITRRRTKCDNGVKSQAWQIMAKIWEKRRNSIVKQAPVAILNVTISSRPRYRGYASSAKDEENLFLPIPIRSRDDEREINSARAALFFHTFDMPIDDNRALQYGVVCVRDGIVLRKCAFNPPRAKNQ